MNRKTGHRQIKLSKLLSWRTILLLGLMLLLAAIQPFMDDEESQVYSLATLEEVPEYSGQPYVEIHGNQPGFEETDYDLRPFEEYEALDELGRCTLTMACVDESLMPTEDRGSISEVHPTGWEQAEYDFVDGGVLYNRCHLIGYQLTGENANERNLITGTRYMNVDGMLPFENLIADYVRQTGNRVLYRVTPCFQDEELVARGVQLEAWSIEDDGEGVCFNVYCYNVQPGVKIDYATGSSCLAEAVCDHVGQTYVLNIRTRKYHDPDCSSVDSITPENVTSFTGCYETLDARGYTPCGACQGGK